jgi:transketolase C-terminal domain/subunit
LSSDVDKKLIQHLINTKKCVVIEDHYEFGGVGSRIGYLILKNNLSTKQLSEMISLVTDHIGEARLYGESDVANMIAINKLANV